MEEMKWNNEKELYEGRLPDGRLITVEHHAWIEEFSRLWLEEEAEFWKDTAHGDYLQEYITNKLCNPLYWYECKRCQFQGIKMYNAAGTAEEDPYDELRLASADLARLISMIGLVTGDRLRSCHKDLTLMQHGDREIIIQHREKGIISLHRMSGPSALASIELNREEQEDLLICLLRKFWHDKFLVPRVTESDDADDHPF